MSTPKWTGPADLKREREAQRETDVLVHGRVVAEGRNRGLNAQRVTVHFDGERFTMVAHSPEGPPREFLRVIPSAAEAAAVCRCFAVTPYGAVELRRLGHDVSGAGEVERMSVPARWGVDSGGDV
jgi:hypothetical protein